MKKKRIRLTIDLCKEIALARGGRCLSKKFEKSGEKLSWRCFQGHVWTALGHDIKAGKWCQECSTGLGERICRESFQKILKSPFPTSYPDWLRTAEGNKLQLDGFSEKLRIAFEHHCDQHYGLKTRFIKTEQALKRRRQYDSLKRQLCKANGVLLIEIPDVFNRINLGNLKSFIVAELRAKGVKLPSERVMNKIILTQAYQPDRLKSLRLIVAAEGGKLVSKSYLGNKTKISIECSDGHGFDITPSDLKAGKWCSQCSHNKKDTIENMRKLARLNGGRCNSIVYVNAHTALSWTCKARHTWNAMPLNIKKGKWCAICSRVSKGTIGQMFKIATYRGGICLSKIYRGAHIKLKWQCKFGHIWLAAPGKIKQGRWCPLCREKPIKIPTRVYIE